MEKIIKSILLVLAGALINLGGFFLVLSNQPVVEVKTLGTRADATVSEVASSSLTYFRGNNNDPTATTTLLTLNEVDQADAVEIGLEATPTTTPAGSVKVKVEVSQDASLWYPITLDTVTNTGTENAQIILNSESASTTFTWNPGTNGSSTIRLPKFRNVAANYLRVRAWVSASTTLWARGYLLSQ